MTHHLSRLPACSVVVPCYNAGKTLLATLQTARRQTVRDIEIIIVDDGSTDGSPTLVAALAREDARIHLITQVNGGVSTARNAGIRAAKARVIAFLDSDDLWGPDHLATHLQRLKNDVCLGVSFSAARFITADGTISGQSRSKLIGLTPADLLLGNPTTTCSTLVVRSDVFKDAGMFRTHMRHNEDQEWLFRVTMSGWVLAGDATPRVDYRTSTTGLAADLEGMLRGFHTMIAEARKLAPVLVERHRMWATASMQRYLARRAIRLGLPSAIARGYMFAALRTKPSLVVTEPGATLATMAAVLVPQTILNPLLHVLRPQSAHA